MLKPTPTCPLPDIREARIDPSLPVNEACLTSMCRQLQ